MTDKRSQPERIVVEMRAEELPEILRAHLPERPIPGMPYRVTIEPLDDEASKLEALRRDIQVGIDDLEAGRVSEFDVDSFLAEMHRRHGRRDR